MKKEQKVRLSLTATAAAISLAFGAMPAPVLADTINWTGGAYHLAPDGVGGDYWVDGGSNWNTSGNWAAGVPDGTDTVNIDRPTVAPPIVGWTPHNVVQVTNTTPQASIVNVGTASNNSLGQVQINNDGRLTVHDTTNIGQVQGSNGVVTVASGGELINNGNFIVGDAGTGTHNVSGSTETTGKVIIGNQSTGNGTVTVGGSMLNHDTLAVGENGTGRLIVSGSVETDGKVVIANQGNSTGSVLVTGEMINHDALTVGENGNGTLEINGGSVTTDGSTVIASRGNSTSSATLDSGSLTTGGNLTIAEEGTGSLTLANGSTVSATGTTIIGDRTSSHGSVVVGSNSTMSSEKDLLLGENGEASLLVEASGNVNNVNGVMADRRGSRSDATVTGAGSTWTSSGDLTVGYGGDAILNLDRDGTVAVGQDGNGTTYAGFERSSSSTINVGAATKNASDAIEAGHLDAAHLVFGQGQNEVNFNHTDADYQFKAGMEGEATVNQIAGETVLQGNSSKFTGQTNVTGGQLVLNNKLAGEMNVGTDGTLRVGYDNGETGEILSDINNQGLVQFDRSNTYQYDKVISGEGRVEQIGTGKTILTAENTYTGGTNISNGALQLGDGGTTGSIVGDVQIDSTGELAFKRADHYTFGGVVSGDGRIEQIGAGVTELTGDSSAFAGATQVRNGVLAVNGKLGGKVDVQDTAVLRGVGEVGTAVVHQGGTISPGNSIGTLAVTGDLTQHAGSTYDVELETTGARDRLEVAGVTTLDEGSLIHAKKLDNARYELDRRYEVLTSTGGVNGQYQLTGDTNVSTFYSLVDNYDANNVYLDVQQVRNFQEAGYTDNQRSAAAGAQSLKGLRVPGVVPPTHNPLFKAIAYLQSDVQARDAFDQISGEIHASTRTGLIEDSRLIRDAANSRLQSAFTRNGSLSDGSDTLKGASDVAIWAQGIGSWGQTKGDGNAAKLRRDTYGFIGGADVEVADNVRVGALAGYTKTDFKASDRNSTNKSDNFHLGLYGGAQFGQLGLRAGAAYTWSKLDSNRSVNFAGYSDSLSADYRAATTQLFAEVGYQLDVSEKVKLEPYANLAYVNLKTKDFSENGGAAALNSESRTDNQTFSTLGLRASTAFESASGKETTVYGTAGWRHAFGSNIPQSTFSFQDGAAFNIDGVAISRNTAVLGAGIDSTISKNLNLGLSYFGQIGDGVSDHGLRLNASYKF